MNPMRCGIFSLGDLFVCDRSLTLRFWLPTSKWWKLWPFELYSLKPSTTHTFDSHNHRILDLDIEYCD